ncbi:hypothetical protein [Saccharopolyspora taberi]|uniref:Uncharacterized protein n=1 Tax=Saccharopolyspora taberi TaxID=60895 RepID=A0ABN3VLJ9_9PSEU
MHWIEVPAEDGRGNRKALRFATTERGIKVLAPAADVTHVVGVHVKALVELVNRLGGEAADVSEATAGHLRTGEGKE